MNVLTSYPAKSNEAIAINIYDIIGESRALAEYQGQKISELIVQGLNSDKKVILSFKNLDRLTWSFVKGAISDLYESFPEEKIESSISLVDIPPEEAPDKISSCQHRLPIFHEDPPSPAHGFHFFE